MKFSHDAFVSVDAADADGLRSSWSSLMVVRLNQEIRRSSLVLETTSSRRLFKAMTFRCKAYCALLEIDVYSVEAESLSAPTSKTLSIAICR